MPDIDLPENPTTGQVSGAYEFDGQGWKLRLSDAASLAAHIDDASAAHAATAISYAGSAGLSASTVEAALDELDTEKAPLASPTFTGTPVAPTPTAGDSSTTVATTAFVRSEALAPATVAMIGDSITAAHVETGTSPSLQRGANGWLWHANIALGDALRMTSCLAISGKRADQVLSEQVPQVLALSPRPTCCTVLAGTNDLTASRTVAQIQADLLAIYDALTAAGIVVVAGLITPRSSYISSITQINRWIKTLATTRRGFIAVDWFTPLSDATGAPASGMLHDGLHPSHSGAAVMGKALASALRPVVPHYDPFPMPGEALNLLANGMMTGTSGTKGTGITGGLATSWTIARTGSATAVASKVARTDGIPGEWQQFAITATGTDRLDLSASVTTTGMAIGDRLVMVTEYEVDSAATYPHLWQQFTSLQSTAAVGGGGGHLGAVSAYTFGPWAALPQAGVLVSQPWAVPSGHSLPFSAMTMYLRILPGAGNVRVGRSGFYNLGPA